MRAKILNAAVELFLTFGFKSVTMDDIASEIGISKKTIYTHYSTKSKLVQETCIFLFENINKGINDIKAKSVNPIAETFEIKRFVMFNLKGEKTSPHFQLKKYYPQVFKILEQQQFEMIQNLVKDNLKKGINSNYYRDDLPIPFISRIYYLAIMGIKDKDKFPEEEYSNEKLLEHFLEYHLRAICTPKGLKTLEEFKADHENFN